MRINFIDKLNAEIALENTKEIPNHRRIRMLEKWKREWLYSMPDINENKPKVELPNWLNYKKRRKLK